MSLSFVFAIQAKDSAALFFYIVMTRKFELIPTIWGVSCTCGDAPRRSPVKRAKINAARQSNRIESHPSDDCESIPALSRLQKKKQGGTASTWPEAAAAATAAMPVFVTAAGEKSGARIAPHRFDID